MLHSRMVSAFTFFALMGLVTAGCGKANSPKFGNNRNDYFSKPTKKDFEGKPADLDGKWSGTCSLIENGQERTDCSLSMTFHQVQLLAPTRSSLSFDFSFRLASSERQFSGNPYLINENSVTDGSTVVGQMGSGALSVALEKNFQALLVRVVNSRQIAVMTAKAPPINLGFDVGSGLGSGLGFGFGSEFASTSLACPNGYCLTALLEKQ